MTDIDDIIKKNRSFFDSDEPEEGHFERFEQKLRNSGKNDFKMKSLKYLRVASIAVLFIISSIWVFEKIFPQHNNQGISLGEISPEYREVEYYYTQLYKSKIEELNKSVNIDPQLEKELLQKEFNDLDSLYGALQKELGNNKKDERIINAMINYYNTKVEVLNQIINQLNEVKETSKTYEEKTDQESI